MGFIQSDELGELNRLLFAVSELGGRDGACSQSAVFRLCSSQALGGRPIDHRNTFRTCTSAGLIAISARRVRLTEAGLEFIDLNPDGSYELSQKQKHYVVERLMFTGPWESGARALFSFFSPNYEKVTFELKLCESTIPVNASAAIPVFKKLGVIEEAGDLLWVSPVYVADVARTRAESAGVTEESLLQSLEKRRKLAILAEEAVVQYERNRLRSIGKSAEESLVRRISDLDVAAGYDIDSFNGDAPLFDYDRFIEVKSSQEAPVHFYWTVGERRTAERLGPRYWIYFVGSFRASSDARISPILVQDPAASLGRIAGLSVSVATVLVDQSGELNTTELPYGGAILSWESRHS